MLLDASCRLVIRYVKGTLQEQRHSANRICRPQVAGMFGSYRFRIL